MFTACLWSDGHVVKLSKVKMATTSKSNVEFVKEEIHDILGSYCKATQKRFIDNIYQQAVEHDLLRSPKSLLAVSTQGWVIKMDAEQLKTMARELPTTSEYHEELKKKIVDLTSAMRILRW